MNAKRFAASCVAVYAVYQTLSYVLHQVLLGPTYASLASVWRPEAEMTPLMWIPMTTGVVWAILYCYIFTRGYEGRGPLEGVRYGLLMGLLLAPVLSYDWYMVLPITIGLAHAWFFATLAISTICGLVLALVYRS